MSLQYRTPSRLGRPLSVIGQGCWQIGADWGDVSDESANAVLDAAREARRDLLRHRRRLR